MTFSFCRYENRGKVFSSVFVGETQRGARRTLRADAGRAPVAYGYTDCLLSKCSDRRTRYLLVVVLGVLLSAGRACVGGRKRALFSHRWGAARGTHCACAVKAVSNAGAKGRGRSVSESKVRG